MAVGNSADGRYDESTAVSVACSCDDDVRTSEFSHEAITAVED